MIPQFLTAYSDINVPAPPGFQEALLVEWARQDKNLIAFPARGQTAAQRQGLRFEKQVQSFLFDRFPELYFNNPWFTFRDATGTRRCRPDGLLLTKSEQGVPLAIIFEIKIRHMPDAWWQLRRLYSPVVAAAFPDHQTRLIEVVKEFDPAMPFPERPLILNKLEEITSRPALEEIGVFIWTR